MRITLHTRIELALATVLLLGSCGEGIPSNKFSDAERDEIGDIAGDSVDVDDAISANVKVTDLESRVEAIESRLGI